MPIETAGERIEKTDMKLRTLWLAAVASCLFSATLANADDLFRLYWRGTYYTTNATGHIITRSFSEQDFVNQVAHDNGLDPSTCIFVYRPDRRDTVVVRSNGAFVADVIQMEYVWTDISNPNGSVIVRQALLFDESHQNALGSWMGLEMRSVNAQGALVNDKLTGWMQYSKPELGAIYGGQAFTGDRVVDHSGG